MFARVKLFVLSLVAVWAAFFAYRLLVVPFLEPSVQQREPLIRPDDGEYAGTLQELRLEKLRKVFERDAWELDNPKVLETDKGMVLLDDYQTLPDGQLTLNRCTLVFCPPTDKDGDDPDQQRLVVLRAPQGARLRFEGGLDLSRGQIGRLQGGNLTGPITIFSPESQPGANDRLDAHTQDVQLTPDRIVAPGPVDFRYGPSSGRGRDLTVTLSLPSESKNATGGGSQHLGIGAPALLELTHVELIELQVQTTKELKRDAVPAAGTPQKPAERLQITCQGPFQFDFPQRFATFRDRVQVLHANGAGPSDQLNCDRLAIQLAAANPSPDSLPATDAAAGKPNRLEIESLEARGAPAVLQAPSYSAAAHGEVLEYNFRTKRVRIVDGQKVLLRYEQHQFEARSVEYQFAEDGRLGQLRATGPGVLRGAMPEDPKKTYEAAWQDRLILQPNQGRHAISLISQARIRFHELGDFAAENIHIWLRETTPPKPGKDDRTNPSYLPDRMLAERHVRIDSQQLSATTNKAEIWLRYEPQAPTSRSATGGAGAPREPSPPGTSDPQRPQQKFDVAGELLQMQLVRQGRELDVEHLIIDGQVRFRETQTAKPGEIPLNIVGSIVQVDHANTPNAYVRVQGQPAEVSARGLNLVGENLQLNRGDGRLWVAGPGNMTLPATIGTPATDDSRASHIASGAPTHIAWKGSMEFNGQVAHFVRDVRVDGVQQNDKGEVFELLIQGRDLAVTLNRRVDFSKNKQDPGLAVRQLDFPGNVSLQNRGSQQGQPTSLDQMQMRDLSIEQSTGRLQAYGPGWGSSVRRRMTSADLTAREPSAADAGKGAELAFVRIDFEDQITGNITNREVEFHGRVRTIYGPVASWDQTLDPNPVDGLCEGQFLLSSDRLGLVQMGPPSAGEEAVVEMIALGNATVESTNFTARGARISYTRAKELMILEGDGRNDAELWRKGSTTPDAAAREIRCWIRDNRIQWDQGRFLNLGQLGRTLR
ncbi:MAG: hypothetical protein NTY19_30830 [Planctomycetota bacterium]|nr:hypothetical protein [Planctomycetota bacterium]